MAALSWKLTCPSFMILAVITLAAPLFAAETKAAADAEQATDLDVLAEVRAWNAGSVTPVPTEFRQGHVTPKTELDVSLQTTGGGYTIGLPSKAPIPTPTCYQGKLYVSGGFHSREYYCFDAASGKLLWGIDLDDDGPTAAAVEDGVIVFNTESCTIFVVDANSGKPLWSWFLGDPLTTTPTIIDGRVFTAYPAAATFVNEDEERLAKLPPTHVMACFELKTGKIVWQRWIDGDALTSPVAVGNELYVTSSSGAIYRFDQATGEILDARFVRATSAPVVVPDGVFYTRRTNVDAGKQVGEALVKVDRTLKTERFVAVRAAAPHLDVVVQTKSKFHKESQDLGEANGIGGGGFGGGGAFNVPDQEEGKQPSTTNETAEAKQPSDQDPFEQWVKDNTPAEEAEPLSPVAENLGLDNVAGLQGFQGSRGLHAFGRNYNCIGDRFYCTDATSGKILWSLKLRGNLQEEGGFLAAPPAAAGGHIFVATLVGEVLELEPTRGTVLHRYATGKQLRSQPIVVEGRIFVGTQDGKVICLDTERKALTGWAAWGGNSAHTGTSAEELREVPRVTAPSIPANTNTRFPRLRRWQFRRFSR